MSNEDAIRHDGARPFGGVPHPSGGVADVAGAARLFQKAGTNVPTRKPTTALVTAGLYRFSRNPIYLSLSVIHVGIAVGTDNPWMLTLLVPTLIVVRYGVIAREEIYLEEKFGDDYRRYKAAVHRWL